MVLLNLTEPWKKNQGFRNKFNNIFYNNIYKVFMKKDFKNIKPKKGLNYQILIFKT